MNVSKLAASGTLLMAASQCWAIDESVLDLRYEAPATQPGKTTAPVKAKNCTVIIAAPSDQRRNKETLGTTFRDNPIMSKHPVTEWLHSVLSQLTQAGFNVQTQNPSSESSGGTVLSMDLNKMYIWNHGMNLHATLVVDTRMKTNAGPETLHHYRVIGTKLNWVNGDSEFITTLNLAASRLLEQIASDIGKECQSI